MFILWFILSFWWIDWHILIKQHSYPLFIINAIGGSASMQLIYGYWFCVILHVCMSCLYITCVHIYNACTCVWMTAVSITCFPLFSLRLLLRWSLSLNLALADWLHCLASDLWDTAASSSLVLSSPLPHLTLYIRLHGRHFCIFLASICVILSFSLSKQLPSLNLNCASCAKHLAELHIYAWVLQFLSFV